MTDVDRLVDTLVMEGYQLYPYTPSATKNATPTPFGIVYPPNYARLSGATHDRMRMEVLADGDTFSGELRCLAGRVELPGPGEVAFELGGVTGRARLEAGGGRLALEVVNDTEVPDGLDRAEALRYSLLSTHLLARAPGGRFTSPLEAKGCEQINTWPVLASTD